ncbi:MAG: hypothetical protein JW786_03680 [Desulfobacterales bacterium]|nr:hypothetical protein [Desulfobacterales bacterium]
MSDSYFLKIKNFTPSPKTHFGKKGLRLMELNRMGYHIPDGVLLSVEFLSHMVKSCGAHKEIKKFMELQEKEAKNLDQEIIRFFNKIDIDENIQTDLDHQIKQINGFHTKMKFAVRSSALDEDDAFSSFAGQYETRLNVSIDEIWDAIIFCYASWWSDRSIFYRKKNAIKNSEPTISIIIQRQLFPESAGVLFTSHPFDQNKNVMIVEAVKGLADKLVSAEVSPARWEIDKISEKIRIDGPKNNNADYGLNENQLQTLFLIGRELEQKFGKGLDIEWAIEKSILYLLQMRPITSHHLYTENKDEFENTNSSNVLSKNIFSRAIVEDLWSDKMSNVTSSIVFDELGDLYTFKTILKKLKLNKIAQLQSIRVIDGYGYLNSDVLAMLLEYIPKCLRSREITNVFPPAIRPGLLKTPFRLKKLMKLFIRSPFLLNDPAILPFLTVPLLRRHLKKIENQTKKVSIHSYSKMELENLKIELERLLKLQGQLQVKNQWGYGNATVFLWMLHHFATKILGMSEEWFLSQTKHLPANVTFESQERLKKICKSLDEQIIQEAFHVNDSKTTWKILKTKFRNHVTTQLIDDFLDKYKYRSFNRDFIHPRWDEQPEVIIEMITLLFQKDNIKSVENSNGTLKATVFSLLREKRILNLISAPFLFIFIHLTKSFLSLREDLRFGLDKVFYRMRRLLSAMAEKPEFEKLKAIKNGIFFLELNELRSILTREKILDDDMFLIIKKRMEKFYSDRNQSPPYYLSIENNVIKNLSTRLNDLSNIQGIPASPGIVEGKARIIKNSDEFCNLKQGEILIAHNTDPGWTPLFVTASGVIVEMGGILNHCAIVAREYGIPAVVGINDITKKINDGQLIRVDGGTGVVEFI